MALVLNTKLYLNYLQEAEIETLRQEMLEIHKTHTQQLESQHIAQETLKTEVRAKEELISRLKDQSDNEEWQEAMNSILNIEKEKNQELLRQLETLKQELNQAQETTTNQNAELDTQLKASQEKFTVLAEARDAVFKENEELQARLKETEEEFDILKSQQENMVPGDFVEDLKNSMVKHEAEKQEYQNHIEELQAIVQGISSLIFGATENFFFLLQSLELLQSFSSFGES